MSASTVRGTVAGTGRRANPAFAVAVAVAALPLAALGYAVTVASVQTHTHVHVMAGVLRTGIDVFIGAVLGPVVGGLDEEESAAVFGRLTPKTAFLLPSPAFVAVAAGVTLTRRLGLFDGNAGPWLALFTAANLVPVLLLFGWRLEVLDDRRWRLAFAVATVGSLAWVALAVGRLRTIEPTVVVALAVVTILSVQGFGVLLPGELRIYK